MSKPNYDEYISRVDNIRNRLGLPEDLGIKIYPSTDINAYAAGSVRGDYESPHILISTKMIDSASSDDELALILSHEYEHLAKNHTQKGLDLEEDLSQPNARSSGMTFVPYTGKKWENEADEGGLKRYLEAGYDPKFITEGGYANSDINRGADPKKNLSPLDDHRSFQDREVNLRKHLDRAPSARLVRPNLERAYSAKIVSDPLSKDIKNEERVPDEEQSLDPFRSASRSIVNQAVGGPLLQNAFPADSTAGAALGHGQHSALLGFGDEVKGATNTLADRLAGISPTDSLLGDYQANRDLERLKLQRQSSNYPMASMAGELGGTAASFGLPFGSIGAAAKTGAALGAMQGLGRTEAGLDDPQLYQDTALGGVLGSALSAGGAVLPKVGQLFSSKTGPSNLAAQIAGGGAVRSAPSKLLRDSDDIAASLASAEKHGILKQTPSFGRDGRVRLQQEGESLKQKAQAAVTGKTPLDFSKLETDTQSTIQGLASKKHNLLAKVDSDTGNTYGIDEMLNLPKGSGKDLSSNLDDVIDTLKSQPDSLSELQSLQAARKLIGGKERLTLKEWDQVRQQLGVSGHFDKASPPGSPLDKVRGSYFSIRDSIRSKAGSHLGEKDATLLKQYDDELHNLSNFESLVKSGTGQKAIAEARSEGGVISGMLPRGTEMTLPGIVGMGVRNIVEPTASVGLNLAGKALPAPIAGLAGGSAAANAEGLDRKQQRQLAEQLAGKQKMANKPDMKQYMGTVFPSYRNEMISSPKDIALAKHYIETNRMLTPQDKAKQIMALNTMGRISDRILPSNVTNSLGL